MTRFASSFKTKLNLSFNKSSNHFLIGQVTLVYKITRTIYITNYYILSSKLLSDIYRASANRVRCAFKRSTRKLLLILLCIICRDIEWCHWRSEPVWYLNSWGKERKDILGTSWENFRCTPKSNYFIFGKGRGIKFSHNVRYDTI